MENGDVDAAVQPDSYGLRDLLCEQVRDLYDAADRFRSELDELLEAAVSSDLTDLLQELRSDYSDFADEIAKVCESLSVPAAGVTCEAMKGLVRECKDTTKDWDESATRDAAIIANAQRVSHYAIAGFGTAAAFAHTLKLKEHESTFRRLLHTAVTADTKLSRLGRGGWFTPGINHEAAHQG